MSYRILLIDHDTDGLERIQRPLTEAGYEVVVASAAEEGLRTFERVRPDLLLIEALLPEKPGSELCREIKDTAQGKGIPVVLLLEEDEDKQARARALDLHDCDLLIERSIEEDDLLALCEELLEKRQAQAEAMGDEDEGGQEEETEPPTEQSDEPVAADATVRRMRRMILRDARRSGGASRRSSGVHQASSSRTASPAGRSAASPVRVR